MKMTMVEIDWIEIFKLKSDVQIYAAKKLTEMHIKVLKTV